MTENKDRELTRLKLAGKFAEGDKDRCREWVKTIMEAVRAGTLKPREERTQAPSVYRRPQTVGYTTLAGMPARVVHQTPPRQAVQTVTYRYTPAAVAAWLRATMPSYTPPALVLAWLGTEWAASIPTPPSMLLVRAARIANFDVAKGWPDALTFEELAKLQYPDSKESQADFVSLIEAYVKQGVIERVSVDRPMPIITGPEENMWPCPALARPAFAAFMQAANQTESEYLADWLGKPRQKEQHTAAAPLAWEAMTPEQKKAAWDAMTKEGRQAKAPELVRKHNGNKAAAGREVGITGRRIIQILAEAEEAGAVRASKRKSKKSRTSTRKNTGPFGL